MNVEVPAEVAVPLKTPFAPSVTPAGSEPFVTAKVIGRVPPEVVSDPL